MQNVQMQLGANHDQKRTYSGYHVQVSFGNIIAIQIDTLVRDLFRTHTRWFTRPLHAYAIDEHW